MTSLKILLDGLPCSLAETMVTTYIFMTGDP